MAIRLRLPTQRILNELFEYNPKNGDLIWKVDFGMHRQGKPVGSADRRTNSGQPYLRVSICGVSYMVHLLIWVMVTGSPPEEEVDHLDRDSLNNRWKNLRACTRSQNQANTGLYKNNRTGLRGVHVFRGRFRAMISKDGKNRHIGYFVTRQEAEEAWKLAAVEAHGSLAVV